MPLKEQRTLIPDIYQSILMLLDDNLLLKLLLVSKPWRYFTLLEIFKRETKSCDDFKLKLLRFWLHLSPKLEIPNNLSMSKLTNRNKHAIELAMLQLKYEHLYQNRLNLRLLHLLPIIALSSNRERLLDCERCLQSLSNNETSKQEAQSLLHGKNAESYFHSSVILTQSSTTNGPSIYQWVVHNVERMSGSEFKTLFNTIKDRYLQKEDPRAILRVYYKENAFSQRVEQGASIYRKLLPKFSHEQCYLFYLMCKDYFFSEENIGVKAFVPMVRLIKKASKKLEKKDIEKELEHNNYKDWYISVIQSCKFLTDIQYLIKIILTLCLKASVSTAMGCLQLLKSATSDTMPSKSVIDQTMQLLEGQIILEPILYQYISLSRGAEVSVDYAVWILKNSLRVHYHKISSNMALQLLQTCRDMLLMHLNPGRIRDKIYKLIAELATKLPILQNKNLINDLFNINVFMGIDTKASINLIRKLLDQMDNEKFKNSLILAAIEMASKYQYCGSVISLINSCIETTSREFRQQQVYPILTTMLYVRSFNPDIHSRELFDTQLKICKLLCRFQYELTDYQVSEMYLFLYMIMFDNKHYRPAHNESRIEKAIQKVVSISPRLTRDEIDAFYFWLPDKPQVDHVKKTGMQIEKIEKIKQIISQCVPGTGPGIFKNNSSQIIMSIRDILSNTAISAERKLEQIKKIIDSSEIKTQSDAQSLPWKEILQIIEDGKTTEEHNRVASAACLSLE